MPSVARHGRTVSVVASDTVRNVLSCENCGQAVRKLTRIELQLLHNAETEKMGLDAFECERCSVVLFEDELRDEAFVPYFMTRRKTWKK